MRALVRHQWVREHGTPRLSVLVGEVRARLLGGPVDPLVVSDPAPPPKLP